MSSDNTDPWAKWGRSKRRQELPPDWRQRRLAVARRAGWQCEAVDPGTGQRCPNRGSECDHRVHRDDHRVESLQWLCADHHKAKTRRESEAAAAARRAKLHPPQRKHPGLR